MIATKESALARIEGKLEEAKRMRADNGYIQGLKESMDIVEHSVNKYESKEIERAKSILDYAYILLFLVDDELERVDENSEYGKKLKEIQKILCKEANNKGGW